MVKLMEEEGKKSFVAHDTKQDHRKYKSVMKFI